MDIQACRCTGNLTFRHAAFRHEIGGNLTRGAEKNQNSDIMANLHQDFQTLQKLAEAVQQNDDFEAALSSFLRFSGDMRAWVLGNFSNRRIQELARRIPDIEYEGGKPSLWSRLSGGGGIGMYKDFRKREEARAQVRETAKLFRAIYPLVCDEMDEGLV